MSMLESEKVSVAAPTSFQGSAERIWRWSDKIENENWRLAYKALAALFIIPMAWIYVLCWYVIVVGVFGLLFIPYRMIRRSQRGSKRQNLQHREMIEALKNK